MCNVSGALFGARQLNRDEIAGRRVLEVGAYDVNGSLRPLLASWSPAEYIGVDLAPGPGVDVVCDAAALVACFGAERFDVVVSTETLEHVPDWRAVVSNMKRVCVPGGTILITTRAIGYPYHGHPHDYWRFEPEDMRRIFADCEILALESDPMRPGVFLKVRKPRDFQEATLADLALYSIVASRRVVALAPGAGRNWKFVRGRALDTFKQLILRLGARLQR